MPSRIDRGARFAQITEATARVVAAEGLAAASLRRVAAEAGLPLHALRHLCPDQDTLHQRTVKWLRRRAEQDVQPSYGCTTPEQLLRWLVESLVPRSEDARMRARAWAAFRRDARPDSLAAEVVALDERQRINEITRFVDGVRRLRETEPRPSTVIYASEYTPPHPDDMDDSSLHVLALAAGLTSLLAEHRHPLSPEALHRWLQRLAPVHLDLPA